MRNNFIWDVGGSGIKAAVLDADGEIVCRWKEPLPDCYQSFLAQLTASYREKEKLYSLAGVGLSLPAKVDFAAQRVLGYGSVPYLCAHPEFISAISETLSVPVVIENDARCAALGDYFRSGTMGKRVYIVCGTGIGGAVIENGKLCGNGLSAPGEWGSLYAGGVGKESVFFGQTASVGAVVGRIRKQTGLPLAGKEIFTRAETGEEPFAAAVARFYFYLAALAYNLHTTYLPDEIVFGGAVSGRPDFLPQLQSQLALYFSYSVQNKLIPQPVLTVCRDGNDANLYGAFLLLQQALKGEM